MASAIKSPVPPRTDLSRRQASILARAARFSAKRRKYDAKCAQASRAEQALLVELVDKAAAYYEQGHVDESVVALAYIVSHFLDRREIECNALCKNDDGSVSLLITKRTKRVRPTHIEETARLRDGVIHRARERYAGDWSRRIVETRDPIVVNGKLNMVSMSSGAHGPETETYVKYTAKTAKAALAEALDRVHAYKARVVDAVAARLNTAEVPELIISMAGGCPMSLWDRVATKRVHSGDTTEEDD